MAVSETSLQLQAGGPGQGSGEPQSGIDLSVEAGRVQPGGPSPFQFGTLLKLALWFAGGLLVGGTVLLFLMPGMFNALVSWPILPSRPSAPVNQFSETAFLPSLIGQPFFIISLLLSFAPLLGAAGIIAAPRLRNLMKSAAKQPAPEEPKPSPEQPAAVAEQPAEDQPANTTEEKAPDTPLEETPEPPPAPPEGQEQEEDEKKEEEEEEEEEEGKPVLGDLASLFEEEDTSLSSLEALSKGLSEIGVDDLVGTSGDTARQLQDANSINADQVNQAMIHDELARL